jgi:hypothetical protein
MTQAEVIVELLRQILKQLEVLVKIAEAFDRDRRGI